MPLFHFVRRPTFLSELAVLRQCRTRSARFGPFRAHFTAQPRNFAVELKSFPDIGLDRRLRVGVEKGGEAMFSRKLAVLAALSLATASTVAQAQSAASLSLASSPAAVERAGATSEGSNELVGTTAWILGAIALGLVIWGIIELTDDDEPTSP
jgi:hypothetical protein